MNENSLLVFARMTFDRDVARARLTRSSAPTFGETLAACRALVDGPAPETPEKAAVEAPAEPVPVAETVDNAPAIAAVAPVAAPVVAEIAEPSEPSPRRRPTLRRRVPAPEAETPSPDSDPDEEP